MGSLDWRRALVLGGIRSGKSAYAERLVGARTGPIRYLATGRRDPDDAAWTARIEAHRSRRPPHWTSEEVGTRPGALADALRAATADEVVLVDDLGTWVAMVMEVTAGPYEPLVEDLAATVAGCLGVLVLVSPEVGLSLVPLTESGRIFADVVGTTNQAVAAACDTVALVVAGNAMRLKGGL